MGSAAHVGGLGRDAGLRRAYAAGDRPVPASREHARISRERVRADERAHRDLLVDGRTSTVAMGWRMTKTGTGTESLSQRMGFPDLAPWLDSVSDEYDELPSGDHEVAYDE